MTIMQSDILNYLYTRFPGCRYELCDDDKVKVTDKEGAERIFTCNIYEDIMDAETKKIVAVSDLPHDLDRIGAMRPVSWVNI